MCLATLQVCLTEKKMYPWTAVQQDTQSLGKARGFGVSQSAGLAVLTKKRGLSAAPLPVPLLFLG